MTFDPTNRAHKAQLYPILKALADLDPRKTPELIMDDAVGYPIPHGKDYASNMRKGDINKRFAALTYDWLMENHFDLAHRISPEIFSQTPEIQWRKILDERASRDALRIIPVKRQLGIVERASNAEVPAQTLKLGEQFLLEYTSDTGGYVIVFQGIRNQWHLVPLGHDGSANAKVKSGLNILPVSADGQPDPLVEQQHIGKHEFVVVFAEQENIPVTIEGLINWLAGNTYFLAVITVGIWD